MEILVAPWIRGFRGLRGLRAAGNGLTGFLPGFSGPHIAPVVIRIVLTRFGYLGMVLQSDELLPPYVMEKEGSLRDCGENGSGGLWKVEPSF